MTTADDPLARYDLADAQALIDDVARECELVDGSTYLVLVHRPATEQRVVSVSQLPDLAAEGWDQSRLSDLLYDKTNALAIPPRSERSASILVTVVVRRGRNGWGWREKQWATAWRYSNHNSDAFDHDIFVVTEHGWCSLWSEAAGAEPRLSA